MRFQKALSSLLAASLLVSMPGPGVYQALAQEVRPQVQNGAGGQGILGLAGAQAGVGVVPGDLGGMTLSPGASLPSLPAGAVVPAGGLAVSAAMPVSAAQAAVSAMSAVPSAAAVAEIHPLAGRAVGLAESAAPEARRKSLAGAGVSGMEGTVPAAEKTRPEPRERRTLFQSLGLPSLIGGLGREARPETVLRTASEDFTLHAGGGQARTPVEWSGLAGAVPFGPGLPGARSGLTPSGVKEGSPAQADDAPVPAVEARTLHRSTLFPALAAAVSAGALVATLAASAALSLAVPSVLASAALPALSAAGSILHSAFQAAAAVFSVAAAWAAGWTLWDAAVFAGAMSRGKGVDEAEFWRFARKELSGWDLHPSVVSGLLGNAPGRGMLKTFRPSTKGLARFSLGMTQGDSIYVRPELARTPWLFRWVLKHELSHYQAQRGRAPPAGRSPAGRLMEMAGSEARARLGEWLPRSRLRSLRVGVLERVLKEAQISLRLGHPYEVLLVDPGAGDKAVESVQASMERSWGLQEVQDPRTFQELSGGKARLSAGGLSELGRYRLAVLARSFDSLPVPGSLESKRMGDALQLLDEIYMFSQSVRGLAPEELRPGSEGGRRLQALAYRIGLGGDSAFRTQEGLQTVIARMYLQTALTRLKGLGMTDLIEKLFAGLQDRGAALLPFSEGDPGVETIEKLLRYWQSAEGGAFRVQRVDLAEGGHVLVARKAESRVQLWLKPQGGTSIADSRTNLDIEGPRVQEAVLRSMGFSEEEIGRFAKAGLRVRHLFGADVGENRAYVSVLKTHARALRRYADAEGMKFEASRSGYTLHLIESGGIQNVAEVWKLRIQGEGGRIYDIDTGLDTAHPDFADRVMESVDFVGEGPEDWIGHGTHKAGISYANGTLHKGMAPKALGRMGKVFSQGGFGASDGDIMAAAVDAMKWGADVVSLSLGSPGGADAPLAEFFSKLMLQKNSVGESPIGTGSAGNSGPFNRTLSQPSVGVNMISVAAAAKSLDDKEPEIAFYSSVGPALDGRFSMKRLRLKPEITALGGDVTTPPGVKDVYEQGIESAKSKDMAPGPSDSTDGKHTRMSGTSMSNPMIAGIALLVKQSVKLGSAAGAATYKAFMEALPFSVKMILMSSAVDMRVPVFFQGAGFVDALAAVRLAAKSFGSALLRSPARLGRTFLAALGLAAAPAASEPAAYEWIGRVQAVLDAEDRVYAAAEEAKKAEMERLSPDKDKEKGHPEAPSEPEEDAPTRGEAGDAAAKAMAARFNEVRAAELPGLLGALKDEAWLVRLYAAFTLVNLRAPEAVQALSEAALNDADGRVRQVAFLALAETPSYAADELLRKAVSSPQADIGIYAAYVLARHGDGSGVGAIAAQTRSQDKKVRFSAAWLLGQLGARSTAGSADALGSRVRDEKERGNIRHLSAASLAETAAANPSAVSDEAVLSLLAAAGPQNFALTRTISRFFKTASGKKELLERMKEGVLRGAIADFIQQHKASVNKPGALGEMVALLARMINVPLDMPSPVPDKNGAGLPGVDPRLGPVHVLVEMPQTAGRKGAPAPRIEKFRDFRGASPESLAEVASLGMDAETLKRFEAAPQAAMPIAQALWVNVPESKLTAFTAEMESRGMRVRRAKPVWRLLHDTGPASGMPGIREKSGLTGRGVLVAYLDEGGDTSHPAIDASRIKFKRNFSGEGGQEEVESESIGHGTHGMTIVGGTSVDGSPYVGMAPGVDFAVGKVLGANGGSDAMVMAGMEWAASLVEDPLKTPVLVNMSLGGPGSPDDPLSLLVNKLRLKNIAVVAAAGNEGPGEGTVGSPANAALALRIGAVDKKGELTFYSSRGDRGKLDLSWVDFGGSVEFGLPNPYEIVSALSTRLAEAMKDAATTVLWKGKPLYQTMSGTSMAAPHTTGKLAVLIERMAKTMLEKFGRLPDGYTLFLEDIVRETARVMGAYGPHEVGAGLIDETRALAALEEALKDPARVAAASEALGKKARERYGEAPAQAPKASWLKPFDAARSILRRWVLPALTFFALPFPR